MGCYPGARLVYGIDLGVPDEKDYDSDRVYRDLEGFYPGLSLEFWGNLEQGSVGYVLAGPHRNVYAYDCLTVTPEMLQVPDEVTLQIRQAWATLFPNRTVPDPRWMITVHYG